VETGTESKPLLERFQTLLSALSAFLESQQL
jgi:hypothetical protein